MDYHSSIIELIIYILSRGENYLDLIDSGNAYDKILRNYHQFNIQGKKVYRNLALMKVHYRFTKDAWAHKDKISELHCEHLVPLKIIKDDLRAIIGKKITQDKITAILHKTEIVVLTKDQSKKLDLKYKSIMPENGLDRLRSMKFSIEPKTKNNSIFNK
jgi:hypothetical protein